MPATIIGLNTLTFGTSDEASSVVRSYEESIKCDPVELLSGDGTFQAVAFANPNASANITLVSSSVSGGSIGAAFSYNGNGQLTGKPNAFYIESMTKTLTNDGFAEIQIAASGWTNLGSAT